MNTLIIGAGDKSEAILKRLQPPYLIIDDGHLIDQLPKKGLFNTTKTINVLKDMDYRRARDFIAVLNAAFPEGETTLTRKNSNFLLLKALLDKPKSLSDLIVLDEEDPASVDAHQKIQTLLLSPVLRHVLTGKTTPRMDTVVLARLPRAELGDFDCFVLAHFLISLYPGQVVIPDFGFYGRDYLSRLIRENRLICGVQTLSELSPKLRQSVLLMPDKTGVVCTIEDAETLADYMGYIPGTNEYNAFILDRVFPYEV